MLLWCLLIALPFQGFAAAGAFACAHASAPACHDMEPDDGGGSMLAKAACDACGSCGMGAAMAPPPVPALEDGQRPVPASFSFLVHLPAGAPDSLERPPRSFLA